MLNWNNLDTTRAFEELKKAEKVDLTKAMVGESGGERVRKYHVPMAAVDKYESLLNGDIINTGEKRHVLHQLTRGQLKGDVIADGVNKRAF